MRCRPDVLSIVTPAFNEAANLDALYARIAAVMDGLGIDWEWIVVDDHSRDTTFEVLERLAALDARVAALRLARNSGSHAAIMCGLHQAQGDAAVMMAADLQDTPETVGVMMARWREGAQVVWAVRRQQPGERAHAGFAAFYYWIMRHVVGMKEMPARGADFFLLDRVVLDAFRTIRERNLSVLALITWLGFKQSFIEYDKQPRVAGRSGWTLGKKIKLVVDSVTGFSDAPVRACSYTGVALMLMAPVVCAAGLIWSSGATAVLLFAMTGLSGLQLLGVGIVGEYVWRALDASRGRPPYMVERSTRARTMPAAPSYPS